MVTPCQRRRHWRHVNVKDTMSRSRMQCQRRHHWRHVDFDVIDNKSTHMASMTPCRCRWRPVDVDAIDGMSTSQVDVDVINKACGRWQHQRSLWTLTTPCRHTRQPDANSDMQMRNRGFQVQRASSVRIGCTPGRVLLHSPGKCSRFPPKTPFAPENCGYAFWEYPKREFVSGGLVSTSTSLTPCRHWGHRRHVNVADGILTLSTLFRQSVYRVFGANIVIHTKDRKMQSASFLYCVILLLENWSHTYRSWFLKTAFTLHKILLGVTLQNFPAFCTIWLRQLKVITFD
jgi:hypothetical protein